MKVRFAIAVAALQVGLLAFMAGQREWISRFGDQLTLRTAPVDPNDPMRGAYVRLNYEINWVPAAMCQDATTEWMKITDYKELVRLRDRVVFASLRNDAHGIANLTALSDRRPESGPFLRGRVEAVVANGIHVRFGIEAFFMDKASALRVEREAANEKAGAPMNVVVAASGSGIGVAKRFEWEPLGITLEFDRQRQPIAAPGQTEAPAQPQPPTILTLTLHNYGEEDLAVVDLPGGHSFRLVPNDRFLFSHYAWSAEGRVFKLPAPKADAIVVIRPGGSHKVELDLADERWWIVDKDKPELAPFPMQQVQDGWSASFRMEYAPPAAEMLAGLPNAGLVRHTSLRTRAFNASRGID